MKKETSKYSATKSFIFSNYQKLTRNNILNVLKSFLLKEKGFVYLIYKTNKRLILVNFNIS